MIEIHELVDAGDDVLIVRARDAEGNELEATGWVSATTNHHDAAAYDAKGNLARNAVPRAMTAAEIGEYALGLLSVVVKAEPVPVAFEIPATLADVARKAPLEEVKP